MVRKMKDSGVEWIGEIPEDWEVVTLKSLCTDLYSGGTPNASNSQYYTSPDHGLPFINISDLTNNKFVKRAEKHITTDAAKSKNLKLVNDGYILLAMYASTGTVSILSMESYISQAILAIQTNSKLKKEYLYYFLESFRPHSESYSRGTTQNNLSAEIVKNLKIVFPRIEEQKSIIKMLDQKTSALDDIKATIIREIQTLEAYKKSVITEAVTKGLDKNAEMKDSGIEWIGEIPKHWNVGKTLFYLQMPITDGPHTTPTLLEEGVPFVSAEAVAAGKGKIDFNKIRGYISEEFYHECCKKYVPKIDDIYMIKSGATTGISAIVDTDIKFTIWSPLAVFRADKLKIEPKFLFYILQSNYYLTQVKLYWNYGTQQNIGMRTLEKLKMCVPSIEEQEEILSYLNKKTQSIEESIDIKRKQLEVLDEYKKSLIYEYVTGKREV